MDASPEEPLREYTLCEVRQHDLPDNLWMIIYNKVYDLTNFSTSHPGGAEVLFDCGGVDATEAFEDVGHSKIACDMLEPYLIGSIPSNDAKEYKTAELEEVKAKPRKKVRRKCKDAKKHDKSITILVVLAVLACIIIICIQKLKWTHIIT
ncbi:hypothetical protein OXX80_001087 [Metschnikowia pulcherrima]|nr:hypothetical protein OY671_003500 [Metschnikowia pulcherrima]